MSETNDSGIKWSTLSRPFKPHNKKYFTTIGVTLLVLGLILILVREFLLIGVMLSLAFVSYALATVQPENVTHEISKDGVKTGDNSYHWDEFTGFFFSKRWDYNILNLNTKKKFPGRLMLLLGNQSQESVEKLLAQHLSKTEEPKKDWGEKALEHIGSKLNLE